MERTGGVLTVEEEEFDDETDPPVGATEKSPKEQAVAAFDAARATLDAAETDKAKLDILTEMLKCCQGEVRQVTCAETAPASPEHTCTGRQETRTGRTRGSISSTLLCRQCKAADATRG